MSQKSKWMSPLQKKKKRAEEAAKKKAEADEQARIEAEEEAEKKKIADAKRKEALDPRGMSAELLMKYARKYEVGDVLTPVNKALAQEYYEIAAEKGNVDAQWLLGNKANQPGGDVAAAAAYFERACAQGHEGASFALALIKKAAKDYARAAELFLLPAENGNATAQYHLGKLYKFGRGVAQDDQKAFELLSASSLQGDPRAQFSLALMYEDGIAPVLEGPRNYNGVGPDDEETVALYTIAVESGSLTLTLTPTPTPTPSIIGSASITGGVNADVNLSIFRYVPAIKNLAAMYEEGRGVQEDLDEAFSLYTRAAQEGCESSQNALAFIHATGRGKQIDTDQAQEIFRGRNKTERLLFHEEM